MMSYEDKKMALLKKIDAYTNTDVVIAFSGGVDSSLLVKLACESAKPKGAKVYAVTIQSELQPPKDIEIAARVAKEAGAIHRIIRTHELSESGIQDNPKDRCYLCKKYLFTSLKDMAKALGIENILEGTNKDDLHVYRPGIRAIRELDILSPLADMGLTKVEVRQMAEEHGISVAKRPSSPCLATRFPYGAKITLDKLKNVELGETYIRQLGFGNMRMRVHGDIVRIEIDPSDMAALLKCRGTLTTYLKSLGYKYITMDLEGFRSGSMDE